VGYCDNVGYIHNLIAQMGFCIASTMHCISPSQIFLQLTVQSSNRFMSHVLTIQASFARSYRFHYASIHFIYISNQPRLLLFINSFQSIHLLPTFPSHLHPLKTNQATRPLTCLSSLTRKSCHIEMKPMQGIKKTKLAMHKYHIDSPYA
jgi:hypothetical protein